MSTHEQALMERASRHLEEVGGSDTMNLIAAAIGGRRQYATKALHALAAEGHITLEDGVNRSKVCTVVNPYRQTADPASSEYQKSYGHRTDIKMSTLEEALAGLASAVPTGRRCKFGRLLDSQPVEVAQQLAERLATGSALTLAALINSTDQGYIAASTLAQHRRHECACGTVA